MGGRMGLILQIGQGGVMVEAPGNHRLGAVAQANVSRLSRRMPTSAGLQIFWPNETLSNAKPSNIGACSTAKSLPKYQRKMRHALR